MTTCRCGESCANSAAMNIRSGISGPELLPGWNRAVEARRRCGLQPQALQLALGAC